MATDAASSSSAHDQPTELSSQYDTQLGLPHSTGVQALKDRIKLHYDLASNYYLSLWCVALAEHRVPATCIHSLSSIPPCDF